MKIDNLKYFSFSKVNITASNINPMSDKIQSPPQELSRQTLFLPNETFHLLRFTSHDIY